MNTGVSALAQRSNQIVNRMFSRGRSGAVALCRRSLLAQPCSPFVALVAPLRQMESANVTDSANSEILTA